MKKISKAEWGVKLADTDALGIVYYANYVKWFEIGWTTFLEDAGVSILSQMNNGLFLVVTEAYSKYKTPAKYGDILIIETSLKELGYASLKMEHIIHRKSDNETLVTGFTGHSFVDKKGSIQFLPDDFRERLQNLLE